MQDGNIESIYTLTPMQQGMLFHSLDSRTPHVYFNQFTCTLRGPLDVGSLKSAFEDAVARHAVLRTLFTWERREKPLQLVRRHVEVPWQVLDWQGLTPDEQTLRLESFLQLDRDRGFRLDEAPLMRLALMQLAADEARLVWSFHHIVLDGWSLRFILDEVLAAHDVLRSGGEPELPPAPAFAGYVEWLERRGTSRDEAFWTKQLEGFVAPSCPDFGGDAAGDRRGDLTGQTFELAVGEQLTAELRELARSERVTMNTLVASAWSLLLSRYCDTDDVVFGATVAGRPAALANVERCAGLFINTLPVRARIGAAATPRDLMRAIQASQTAQREFEFTSLQDILRYSDVAAGNPLFETILVFENLPEAGGGSTRLLETGEKRFIERSNFPLAILVVPGGELVLHAVFDGGRFPAAAVRRMLHHLAGVLRQFAADPERRIADVDILTPDERAQITVQWNDTDRPSSEDGTVLDLIERSVADRPQAIAVTDHDGTLTFDEVNRFANRIAHRLLREEAGAAVVYCERNRDAIAGILGALKAGAYYVPLDVGEPAERLRRVLDDLADPVVITRPRFVKRIPAGAARPLVLDGGLGKEPDHNPGLDIGPETLAYVIYTSGSTGRPKGVMVSHGNLMNSTSARIEYYERPVSAYALLSALSTDSAVAGIFWSLATGGNLVIPGGRAELDVERLAVLIRENAVTHTLCVPSLYALILEHADPALLASLDTVIVAGEACPRSVVQRHHAVLPQAALYNEYGPSEACVWASVAKLEDDVTIGRPVANTRLYVLDSSTRPLPVGVAGELCIGGANVAKGYLGREEATRRAFIADPFGGGGRLYRTGDRARYREDGRIEYLGRADHQLKVRGYRVEPGEIEAALTSHPEVESAVVFLAQDPVSDQRLLELMAAVGEEDAERALAEAEALVP